ncbi:hypothetical protein [Longimicrobium sp.]|uniref:hypothetical protein n=1 Tax=Longimicrobium sp. TaxID=2029185 RepID=UPI003B3B6094
MSDSAFPRIEEAPHVIGRVEDGHQFGGAQEGEDTCCIRCEEFVLELFTGQDFDEAELVEEARENGWHQPGGSAVEDVGNLLDYHGVATKRYIHASIFNLASELSQGHKVIIGVNSDELWSAHPVLEHIHHSLGADHTVVVSGIDTTDPEHVMVIVSDPGTGEAAARYPLDTFVSAWADSEFFMVATRDPVPAWAPEMANFDYEAGHIPSVAGLPYDDFAELEEQPEVLSGMLSTAAHHYDFGESHTEHHHPHTSQGDGDGPGEGGDLGSDTPWDPAHGPSHQPHPHGDASHRDRDYAHGHASHHHGDGGVDHHADDLGIFSHEADVGSLGHPAEEDPTDHFDPSNHYDRWDEGSSHDDLGPGY